MDGNIWRLTNLEGTKFYPSCQKMNLGSGILISRDIPNPVLYADHIQFKSFCYLARPVFMAAKFPMMHAEYIPMIAQDWDSYTSTKNKVGRDFTSGIFPLMMAYSANFVLTIFLTFLCFLIIKPRPYLLASITLKVGCLLCSVNLIVAMSQMFELLRDQHVDKGVTISSRVIVLLEYSATYISLHFLSVLTLQLVQVFIVMRTFERNREKRVVLFCGILLTITTSVLWVAPQLQTVVQQKKINWDILPVFVYLFRIAIEGLYTCFIIAYTIRQRKYWMKNMQMIFLTTLAIISVFLLPGFFLADVSNAWIAQFGEIFIDVCYIGSTFLPWEWLERLSVLQRTEQAQSVLGRPIYDNDQQDYAFAKYALKVQDALQRDDDSASTHPQSHDAMGHSQSHNSDFEFYHMTNSSNEANEVIVGNSEGTITGNHNTLEHESINEVNFTPHQRNTDIIKNKIINSYNKFIYFTDQVILKKLGSDSVNSSSNNDTSRQSNKRRQQLIKKRIGLERPPETFVYNTKDVVFDSDDSDDDSGEDGGDSILDNEVIDPLSTQPYNNFHNENSNIDNNSNMYTQNHDNFDDQDFEKDFGKFTFASKR